MSRIELYRELYQHEIDSDAKMLAMIESVPAEGSSDARFQQAVSIAGHLAACRENWLDRMTGQQGTEEDWYDGNCTLLVLRPHFASLEKRWAAYLAGLDDDSLTQEFEFREGDERFLLPTEVQITQLFGHAAYHRGQIALLVNQLGGEVADSDYVDWWWAGREQEQ